MHRMLQKVTLDSVLAKYNHDFPFHPEVLKLGLRYADGTIKGANARCIAMLDMLRQMVEDYTTPAGELLPQGQPGTARAMGPQSVCSKYGCVGLGRRYCMTKEQIALLGEVSEKAQEGVSHMSYCYQHVLLGHSEEAS